jgi:hypothetical protein
MFLVRVGGGKYVGEIYYFLQHITLPQLLKQRGVVVVLGGVLVLTELASNIAVVYLNLRKKRVKERSPQCRIFKIPCQVQRKYSSDK